MGRSSEAASKLGALGRISSRYQDLGPLPAADHINALREAIANG